MEVVYIFTGKLYDFNVNNNNNVNVIAAFI